jgi:hypothetical protein
MRVPLRRLYRHWAMWVGLGLCGLCAGIGGFLGSAYFGHGAVPAGLGGGIGGYLVSRIHRYVVERYKLDRP